MVRKEIIYVTKEDIQMPGLWVRDRSITCGSFGKCLRFPVTKKESSESLRLRLDKISCTRQFESKLSLRSFAKSLAKGSFFRKPTRPSLPLRKAPPLISVFFNGLYTPFGSPVSGGQKPQGRRGKPLLLVARNRYALRLAGHQSPRHILRDGTALL